MNDYSRPTPTLPDSPAWTLEHLKRPLDGRTYGTAGTHLVQEVRKYTASLAVLWGYTVFMYVLGNAGALAYIRRLAKQPETGPSLINTLLAGLVIANVILAFVTGVVSNIRERTGKRARVLAGLRGERRVAEALAQLPKGYFVIHGIDITAPNRPPEDIDHLVIGPNGITMIDAKNWGGELIIDDQGVHHHGQLDTSLIEGTRRRAQTLAAFLGYDTSIRQIVCFTGSARRRIQAHGIHFTDLNGLKNTITHGSRVLTPETAKELAEDAALLAPTATTRMPWRHYYLSVSERQQRPYKLRFLKRPVTALHWLSTLAFSITGIWAVIQLFHLYTNDAMETVFAVLATFVSVVGAVAAVFIWRRTNRFRRYLTITHVNRLGAFQAPRAPGRMTRIHAANTATTGSTRPPRSSHSSSSVQQTRQTTPDASNAASLTRAQLEEAFSKDLILPKDTLEELITVQMLLTRSEEFRATWGQDLPYGIILHGPPGTGKTQVARTIAKTAGFSFYAAKPSELRDMYVGESAKRIAELYEEARKNAPAMVFLDELDATAGQRRTPGDGAGQENNHAVNQLLQEIDGIVKHEAPVFTIGATNLLDGIDDAIRSRLAYRILIGLPDELARERMWRRFAAAFLHRIETPLAELVQISEGMSGRDIKQACQIAAQLSFSSDSEQVTRATLERAFERVGHKPPAAVN